MGYKLFHFYEAISNPDCFVVGVSSVSLSLLAWVLSAYSFAPILVVGITSIYFGGGVGGGPNLNGMISNTGGPIILGPIIYY